MNTRLSVAALLGLALSATLVLAQTEPGRFRGLDREMSAEERAAAGVDGLSAAEMGFLNDWLRTRFNQVAEDVTAEVRAAASAEQAVEIERRVAEQVQVAREELRDEVKQEIEAAEASVEEQEPFEAVIVGNFTGWSGKTVFTLDNGQVWRQRHGSDYRHTQGGNRVRFETNFLGMWHMTVLSSGRAVPVRRID